MFSLPQPEPFLEVRAEHLNIQPSVSGLCVGYERGQWRASQFAEHVTEWLPEFALTISECASINSANTVARIRKAARKVYQTDNYGKRGEFGELFLHIAMRQFFKSSPVISKIYYKSSVNDNVKGFDAVHVVEKDDGLELWLGEAKFFEDIDGAIKSVVNELESHLDTDYLRNEFCLISDKIDSDWPHEAEIRKLLSPNTSLDEVFKRVCIPVLLTYDSKCLASHTVCDAAYEHAFETEILNHYERFKKKAPAIKVHIHLFLLPLHTKATLVRELDGSLKKWQ